METNDGRAQTLRLLKDSVARCLDRESPLARARALRGHSPDFDSDFWARLAGQGWVGLLAPESLGGSGLGFLEMAAVVEACAARVAPEPLVATAVFLGRVLQHCPPSEPRDRLLAGVAAGELIGAVAWQETHDRIDTATARTRIEMHGGHVTIAGEKRFVRPGSGNAGFIVSTQQGADLVLCWVPADAPGLSVTSEALADGTVSARLRLDDIMLDANHCLACGRAAAAALSRAFDEAAIMVSVELLALARAVLGLTLEYLRQRVQFGAPIGRFQALQHRAVDLHIQQELLGAVVAQALAHCDASAAGDTERASLASRAKSRATDAALLIAREAVQLHGAIGLTDEYALGLYFNRILVLAAWLGNGLAHRRRYAALNPLRAHAAQLVS